MSFKRVLLSFWVISGLLLSNLQFAAAKTSVLPKKISNQSPTAAYDAELKILKEIDRRYQTAESVSMDIEKTLTIGLLGREKKSKGRLTLSKGKMRMEFDGPEKSLVVIDGKTIWVVDYPDEEFQGATVQVMKGEVSSKKGSRQSFVGLLTRGDILKQFKVVGVQNESAEALIRYFLQPAQQSSEFKRAQLALSKDKKQIVELRYWDERDNETHFLFANIKFNQPVKSKLFKFTPPENSAVTAM